MNVRTVFDINKVDHSKDNVVNLMVSVEAPPLPADFKRNKASIVACLDCSGSMSGDKMENLKQTMYKLIDNLTDVDRLGIVWFGTMNGGVERVAPMIMDSVGKESIKNIVSSKEASGSTPLVAGVTMAFKEFGLRKNEEGMVERVILLTDGQADTRDATYDLIKKELKDARKDISMSCFGYGSDYNETLLESLSKDYNGGNYFVDSVKMLPEAFAHELGSLLTCYATELKVSAASANGAKVEVVSVLNDMPSETLEDEGRKWFKVNAGDIFYGEKKRIFLRFKCKSVESPSPNVQILDVNVERRLVGEKELQSTRFNPVLSFVIPEEVDLTPDPEVAEQVLVMDAAKTQVEAKNLADQGEWQMAKEICDKVIENLEKYGTQYTRSFADVMKESSSGFNRGYRIGGLGAKSASSASYTVLRGGRGMTGGSAGLKMKAFASSAYDSNAVTMSLVDSFADKSGSEENKDKDA
jgi:uncharacterized protein YegL